MAKSARTLLISYSSQTRPSRTSRRCDYIQTFPGQRSNSDGRNVPFCPCRPLARFRTRRTRPARRPGSSRSLAGCPGAATGRVTLPTFRVELACVWHRQTFQSQKYSVCAFSVTSNRSWLFRLALSQPVMSHHFPHAPITRVSCLTRFWGLLDSKPEYICNSEVPFPSLPFPSLPTKRSHLTLSRSLLLPLLSLPKACSPFLQPGPLPNLTLSMALVSLFP